MTRSSYTIGALVHSGEILAEVSDANSVWRRETIGQSIRLDIPTFTKHSSHASGSVMHGRRVEHNLEQEETASGRLLLQHNH